MYKQNWRKSALDWSALKYDWFFKFYLLTDLILMVKRYTINTRMFFKWICQIVLSCKHAFANIIYILPHVLTFSEAKKIQTIPHKNSQSNGINPTEIKLTDI